MDAVTKLFAEQNLHVVPASRMNEVAHDERTNAMKDLHCASEMIEETSDLIVEKLKILDLEISRIKESEREAFDVALKQDPQYIQGLKLRFLRADRFQASSAAQRMVKHFDLKRALFNADEELLGRDIKYSDFEKRFPEDLPALTAGFIQFLPERDRAGRAVFFINPIASGTAYYPIASVCRISFWLLSTAANLEDVQMKGFIVIWWGCGVRAFSGKPEGRATKFLQTISGAPLYLNGMHCCFDDFRLKIVFDFLARTHQSLGDIMRLQTHYGSDLECRYNLMTYGVQPHILPLGPDGTPHDTFHRSYLQKVIQMEKESDQRSVATSVLPVSSADVTPALQLEEGISNTTRPGPKDIVMGRGRRGIKSAGNIALKILVEENYRQYCDGSKFDKTIITHILYEKMKEKDYHFIERRGAASKKPFAQSSADVATVEDPNDWVEISEETARLRIAQLLRNLRSSHKKEAKKH